MNRIICKLSVIMLCLCAAGCSTKELEREIASLEDRVGQLSLVAADANANAVALKALFKDRILIVGMKESGKGYTLDLSDGTTVEITYGASVEGIVPIVGVTKDGEWVVSIDGGKTFTPIEGAAGAFASDGATPALRVDENGLWQISLDGGESWDHILDSYGKPLSAVDGESVSGNSSFFANVVYDKENSLLLLTFANGDTLSVPVEIADNFFLKVLGWKDDTEIASEWELRYSVELSDVVSSMIKAPKDWAVVLSDSELKVLAPKFTEVGHETVTIIIVSSKGYMKSISLRFVTNPKSASSTGCKVWDDFANNSPENLLLDYSYAGYNHGESAPEDVYSLGYKIYDVTAYGAVPNDGKSDRDAFKKAYQAALGSSTADRNDHARAIIYFPEGEFILHTSDDDVNGATPVLSLRVGDFIIKGAGRDKTTIYMQDPALPSDPSVLYSSPSMIEIKHYSGLSDMTTVTEDAARGTFSVTVASTSNIAADDYVCLCVENNDAAYIAKELAPYSVEPGMTDLLNNGVKVYDYHQVKSVKGNVVTFYEPLMHEVEAAFNWRICKYPHYGHVGVEDITFKGDSKADFVHHGSWQDDGAYKPIVFTRVANAWLRRCRFTSVSEAFTMTNCCNVSVYDVLVDGNRGHASIRSQGSSRVFIGAVTDTSGDGAGQYHGTGVSKPALGTVLWRNRWGDNSCFESHATQPRATLVDCCKGGWMKFRQGGDANQVPNHLNDLTIWNMESTTPFTGTWNWYDSGAYWKFVMPIVVGFHGQMCVMNPAQCKIDYAHGTTVNPESLYEEQLRLRLGYVPAWLNALK